VCYWVPKENYNLTNSGMFQVSTINTFLITKKKNKITKILDCDNGNELQISSKFETQSLKKYRCLFEKLFFLISFKQNYDEPCIIHCQSLYTYEY